MDGAPTPPLVIVVNGLPATGKTTLARRLATDLHLPLLAKDVIKETLFETLGWSDRAWSRRLGAATMALLYKLLEEQLRAGRPCIVECNFYPDRDTERFRALARAYASRPSRYSASPTGRHSMRAIASGRSQRIAIPAMSRRTTSKNTAKCCCAGASTRWPSAAHSTNWIPPISLSSTTPGCMRPSSRRMRRVSPSAWRARRGASARSAPPIHRRAPSV